MPCAVAKRGCGLTHQPDNSQALERRRWCCRQDLVGARDAVHGRADSVFLILNVFPCCGAR